MKVNEGINIPLVLGASTQHVLLLEVVTQILAQPPSWSFVPKLLYLECCPVLPLVSRVRIQLGSKY